jgi:phospholipase A2
VHATIWGTSTGPASRRTPYIAIASQCSAMLDRASYIPKMNRELIFSTYKKDLGETLSVDSYKKAARHAAGWSQGTIYDIDEKYNVLQCYTRSEYDKENTESNSDTDNFFSKIQEKYSNHPYAKITANVRSTNELDKNEIQAITNRLAKANNALTEQFGISIADEKTPRIALCLSGGGMRAATCSYGLVAGLADIGILDTITYCASLSGSTWFLTDWILFGQSLDQYYEHYCAALSRMRTVSVNALSSILWPKYIFNQDTSIIDYYGAYLANTFFRQIPDNINRQKVTLSSLGDLIKDGSWPFPLYTAVETSAENHWVTFTPFEVGSDTMHFHIPTWSFGRKFSNGMSVDYAPEQSLGYFMGLWGSALSGSLEDMLNSVEGLNPLLTNALTNVLIDSGLADCRWAEINIHNPLHGYPLSSYRTRNIKDLIFMDAGYIYNIPLPPLLKEERAIDIIIVLDVSQDVHKGNTEFKKAITDLTIQGIQLPPINLRNIKQPISVFTDPDNSHIPTIIYIVPTVEIGYDPLFDPAKEFSTTYNVANFAYSKEAINKITGLMRYIITKNKNLIYQTINDTIAKK